MNGIMQAFVILNQCWIAWSRYFSCHKSSVPFVCVCLISETQQKIWQCLLFVVKPLFRPVERYTQLFTCLSFTFSLIGFNSEFLKINKIKMFIRFCSFSCFSLFFRFFSAVCNQQFFPVFLISISFLSETII